MRKQYSGIDIAKMICAIMVIAIHTQPFIRYVWLDRGAGVITRLAVPFFFVTTGFFLDFSETKKVKMCILRLLVLYAIWTIIYLPFSSLSIRKLLLTGVIGHLWYIPAAIVAVLLTYLVGQPKRSIVISGVLLLIGTLASTYQPLCSGIVGGGDCGK